MSKPVFHSVVLLMAISLVLASSLLSANVLASPRPTGNDLSSSLQSFTLKDLYQIGSGLVVEYQIPVEKVNEENGIGLGYGTMDEYQAIIDRVNEEYGVNFHLYTQEDVDNSLLPGIKIPTPLDLGTLEEFEAIVVAQGAEAAEQLRLYNELLANGNSTPIHLSSQEYDLENGVYRFVFTANSENKSGRVE
jgi:hypothetical protein